MKEEKTASQSHSTLPLLEGSSVSSSRAEGERGGGLSPLKGEGVRPKAGGEVSSLRRSVEVEAVLGQTPHWIFRWGISLIAAIVAALLISTWFIHWPETMTMQGIVRIEAPKAKWAYMVVHLPASQVRTLHEGMAVRVHPDIKDESWGCYEGIVATTSIQKDSTGLYPLHIRIDAHARTDSNRASLAELATAEHLTTTRQAASPLVLDAAATITLTDKRLLQRIIAH